MINKVYQYTGRGESERGGGERTLDNKKKYERLAKITVSPEDKDNNGNTR